MFMLCIVYLIKLINFFLINSLIIMARNTTELAWENDSHYKL
jgi:hypothetical protein